LQTCKETKSGNSGIRASFNSHGLFDKLEKSGFSLSLGEEFKLIRGEIKQIRIDSQNLPEN
jgi:hypothetical protein